MGFSVAAFTGPLVAGFAIDTIGHLRVFLVLATFIVPPLAIMLMTPAMFPRIAAEAGRHARGSVFDLLRMANLRSILIAGSIAFSAWDLFQFYLPIYGYGVGLSASTIGTILAIFSVASFLIRGAVPFLAKRVSEVHLLTSSVFIAALASALLPFFVSAYALAAISFLLGVAVGCTTPVEMSLIYVLTPRDRMAEAMGLRKTVNHGMHFFVPLVFGTLGGTFGATSVFVSNAVLLAMGGFLMRNTRVPGDGHRMTTTIVTPAAPEPRTMPPQ
jgi:MFS family permease